MVDLDATIRGTRNAPLVTGTITISNGRIERVTYDKLVGRVDFSQGAFAIDVRLDQAPGTWLTAKGTVPLALFDRDLPERAIDVAILSSPIDLGLLAGVTDVVNRATGQMRLDVRAIGTSRDPHFDGSVDIAERRVRRDGDRRRGTRTAAPRYGSPRTGSPSSRSISRTRTGSRSTCAAASARTSCASAISRST